MVQLVRILNASSYCRRQTSEAPVVIISLKMFHRLECHAAASGGEPETENATRSARSWVVETLKRQYPGDSAAVSIARVSRIESYHANIMARRVHGFTYINVIGRCFMVGHPDGQGISLNPPALPCRR